MSDCLILVISAPFFAFGAAFGVFATDFGGLFAAFLGFAGEKNDSRPGDAPGMGDCARGFGEAARRADAWDL